jgi:hypothetical protein
MITFGFVPQKRASGIIAIIKPASNTMGLLSGCSHSGSAVVFVERTLLVPAEISI